MQQNSQNMENFNSYLSGLDFSNLQELFQEKGNIRVYHKKEFLVRQGEVSHFAGWIENGSFQYTYINEEGTENIVGYAFPNEFVCDYSSFMKERPSLVNIQAITNCTVYELSHNEVVKYMETNLETQRFGRLAAESLFEMAYRRLLDFYCPPETRYLRLMQRCPNLKEVVPLKNIASFLGVTPETVSHIRKKILLKGKS